MVRRTFERNDRNNSEIMLPKYIMFVLKISVLSSLATICLTFIAMSSVIIFKNQLLFSRLPFSFIFNSVFCIRDCVTVTK